MKNLVLEFVELHSSYYSVTAATFDLSTCLGEVGGGGETLPELWILK